MNEVKRYKADENYPGQYSAREDLVKASDYDAALAEIESWKQGSKIEADAGDEARREVAALREELATVNAKIDQAWNRKSYVDHKGFIPGALDAWKRPVPQDLPYDFSGNPGASATQYCNGWNDSGSYWSAHANDLQQRLTIAEQRNVIKCGLLHKSLNALRGMHYDELEAQILEELSLKPTKSGASE